MTAQLIAPIAIITILVVMIAVRVINSPPEKQLTADDIWPPKGQVGCRTESLSRRRAGGDGTTAGDGKQTRRFARSLYHGGEQ